MYNGKKLKQSFSNVSVTVRYVNLICRNNFSYQGRAVS